jgi:predicted Zn-dependent protease
MQDGKELTRAELERICERVLSLSRADETRVNVRSGSEGNTRFAMNQITTSGDISDVTVTVTSAFDRRVGSATTSRLDDDALARVAEASERLARVTPDDSEYLGELGPQTYVDVAGVAASTAGVTPQARAASLTGVLDASRARRVTSAGFLTHRVSAEAVATSRGLFAFQESGRAGFSATARTPDGTGSGWAGISLHDWDELDARALGERAIEKAIDSRNPRRVEPGRWTVILEPMAVAELVARMMEDLDARAADEGRSYFSRPGGENRVGERFLDERVTIVSNPGEPELRSPPFQADGHPAERTVWVERGELRTLAYDRYWAREQGRRPVAPPAGYRMDGGTDSLDDMIRSTGRGLLLTRLWYIRSVDPRTLLFTGLTRDGTFLIEDGRIRHPVQNLRWNESPIFCLNNIEMIGEPVPVFSFLGLGPPVIVPPLKVRDFSFTSVSDAI